MPVRKGGCSSASSDGRACREDDALRDCTRDWLLHAPKADFNRAILMQRLRQFVSFSRSHNAESVETRGLKNHQTRFRAVRPQTKRSSRRSRNGASRRSLPPLTTTRRGGGRVDRTGLAHRRFESGSVPIGHQARHENRGTPRSPRTGLLASTADCLRSPPCDEAFSPAIGTEGVFAS